MVSPSGRIVFRRGRMLTRTRHDCGADFATVSASLDPVGALRSRVDKAGDSVAKTDRRTITDARCVGMNINQPWEDQLAVGIESFCGLTRDVRFDRRNPAVGDGYVTHRIKLARGLMTRPPLIIRSYFAGAAASRLENPAPIAAPVAIRKSRRLVISRYLQISRFRSM